MLTQLEALTESTQKLSEAGEMELGEARLFPVEHASQELELQRLQAEAADLALSIRALVGLSPVAPVDLLPVAHSDAEVLSHSLEFPEHPAILRRRVAIDAVQSKLDQASRKQRPDLAMGPIIESDRGETSVGIGAAVPLPLFDRNQQAVATADAEREYTEADLDVELARRAVALARAKQRLGALESRGQHIEERLLPMLDEQFRDARRLLEFGEGSGVLLLDSVLRLHEAKLALIEAQRDLLIEHLNVMYETGGAAQQPLRPQECLTTEKENG